MQGEQAKEGVASGGSDRLGALKGRVDQLSSLYNDLQAARTTAKRTRIGVVIVILLVIAVFGWRVYDTVMKFDRTKFMAEVQSRVMGLAPNAMQDFWAMGKRVIPVYRKEFEKQFRAEWPKLSDELHAEAEQFVDTIA